MCEAGEPGRCIADAVLRPTKSAPALPGFASAPSTLASHLVVPWDKAASVFAFSMAGRDGYSFTSNPKQVKRFGLVKTGCDDFHAWLVATLGEMALSESASSEIVRLRCAASPTSVTPSEAAPLLAPW